MTLSKADDGLAVLYATLLIPTFLILLAFVVELGALRLTRARLVAAADIAATSAVNEQDRAALALDGRYRLSAAAPGVARELLANELAPLASAFSGTTPDALAASASIATTDPTTLRIAFDAPVRTPLLVLAALRDSSVLHISVTAAAR
jgi:Flp pilus assembly protein TadG